MLKALVQLQIAVHTHHDRPRTNPNSAHSSALSPAQGERGSVTTEHVLWAVAVIAIVGIVVAAITAYVKTQAGNIK